MEKPDKRKVCRYYARGKCVKQNCPFVHQQQTKKPCKFMQQTGFCRKGKNCQFYHATKQEQKKQKKFVEKVNNKLEKQTTEDDQGRFKADQYLDQQAETKEQKGTNGPNQNQSNLQKIENSIDDILGLKIKQEMYKELIGQNLQGQNKLQTLQFFKIYPKSFPDYGKMPETKEFIKKNQEKYFKDKPFLELINSLENSAQKQYYQIIRKYQDSFQLCDQTQPRIYTIKLRPLLFEKQMNLHFKMQENRIHFKINQLQYPDVKARFQIFNQTIPEAYKTKFIQMMEKYHQKKGLVDTLKYFQNHFEKVYEKAKSRLENQHFKKIQLKQQIQTQKQKIDERQRQRKMIEHIKNQAKTQKGKLQKKIINQEKKKQIIGNKPQQKVKKQYKDYIQLEFDDFEKPEHQNLNDEITVGSMLMQNCAYLIVDKLLLYIECSCSKNLMYLLDAQQRKQLRICRKLKCKKCNDCIRIVWSRQVIQHKQTTISQMGIVNGKIIDIGGVGWKIGCNCDEQINKNKLYLSGEKIQINCHTCFEHMNIMYMGLKFFNPFIKEFQMQDDKQLPLRGSCNHDKFNFRWLRYACCGRPFSCDQCHQLNAIKKHDKMMGLTMICGFCSCQQLIGNQCSKCKKDLLKGIDKGGHWQGGLGCRDQTLLSKKDGKKYAGMTKQNKKKEK